MKITKFALAAALGVIVLLAPREVQADTIFTATGTTFDSETLSGTLTINTSTVNFHPVDAINLSLAGSFAATFTTIFTQSNTLTTPSYFSLQTIDSSSTTSLTLVFPVGLLLGYTGGTLCVNSSTLICPTNIGGVVSYWFNSSAAIIPQAFITASLTPITTPEPSSVTLLGTGLVGLLGLGWRRKRLG